MLHLFPAAKATEYYVSVSGDDTSDGTSLETPFATVAKGISVLQAGDMLYLRGGDYYVPTKIEMYATKGTERNPITISSFSNETAIIKGCRAIGTDGWVQVTEKDRNYLKYFKHSPNNVTPEGLTNIYKKRIAYNIFDLFIDNEGLTLARWPNARDWSPEAWDQWQSRRGVTDRQTHIRIYDHEADIFPGGKLSDVEISLTGCGVAGGLSGFRDARTVVTRHVPGNDYFDHEYIPRITGKDGEKHWSVIRYYLAGLPLLDEEMEWGFDRDEDGKGGTVYVWTKAGRPPSSFSTIDGRVVEHVFVGGPARKGEKFDNAPFYGSATEHVTFDGLTILGGGILMSRTQHVTVQNCKLLYYGSHFFALQSAREPVENIVFQSNHFKFTNNIVKYGQNAAILTEGSKYLVVENNLIEHSSFGGTGCINFADVEFPIFRYNTIRWSGGSTTITFNNHLKSNPPETPEICEYNYIEHIGKFQSDGAAIQRIGRGAANFVFRYNWILHGGRMGIRCDFNTNPIILAHMYRNLIWDCNHNMGFNCEYANIFNNTSFESHAGSDMSYPRSQAKHFPNQNQFTISRNNLGDRIEVTHPMKPEDHFWNGVEENLLTRLMLRDVENKDFRPRPGAPIIDAGTVVTQTRWANPGIIERVIYNTVDYTQADLSDPQFMAYTDAHWTLAGPSDLASSYNGTAPDIGMYEYGDQNYFIPGRRESCASHPIPLHGSMTAESDCDLMWRPARDGESYNIYFGQTPNKLILKSRQTNNIFDPGKLIYGQKYFWRIDTVTASNLDPIPGHVWNFTVEPAFGNIKMEANTCLAGEDWKTVSLANTYSNPVVVCSVNLNQNKVPIVVRIRNAGPHSFDIRLQNASDKPVTRDTIHYLIVEEGSYRLPNGSGLEARRISSQSPNDTEDTDQMERLEFEVNFSRPVVFGQVMTYNDPNWSVCRNRFQTLPWWHNSTLMDSGYCYIGYHTGKNSSGSARSEILGVVIVESGIGEINGVKYEANRKDDKYATIKGVEDKQAPYGNKLINFAKAPQVGIVTQTGRVRSKKQAADNVASWAVLHGTNPLTIDRVNLSIDEGPGGDRKLSDGQKYSYFVLERSLKINETQVHSP